MMHGHDNIVIRHCTFFLHRISTGFFDRIKIKIVNDIIKCIAQ